MNAFLRKSLYTIAATAVLASATAQAADSETLSTYRSGFSKEEAVAQTQQELIQYCQNKGGRPGASRVISIVTDPNYPFIYWAEVELVCALQ